MKHRLRRRSPSGFTLIEMLVVIAIIGILAAILVPAVNSGLKNARKGACNSNVHQIAVAANIMIDENDVLPRIPTKDAFGAAATNLLPYLKGGYEVFDCPSNKGLIQNGQVKIDIPSVSEDVYTEYAINEWLSSVGNARRRSNRITDPDKVAYVFDYPYKANDSKGRVHVDGVNVGYLDGHAAFFLFADYDKVPEGKTTVNWLEAGHDLE